MAPSRWQVWHESWRIGITSRVNVTSWSCADAPAGRAATASSAPTTTPSEPDPKVLTRVFIGMSS